MSGFHTPVLLKEVTKYLKVEKGNRYIDATIGGGGHAFEILKRGGIVLGIDCDQEAIRYVNGRWNIESRKWKVKEENLTLAKGNFREIDKIAHSKGFDKVAGIIFDLGVSSHQLEVAKRGFSFQKEGPLDMRMDASTDSEQAVTARDLVNGLTKGELYELFTKLGEESNAWIISKHIIRARRVKPIETTSELALIIEKATGMEKGAMSIKARASADKKVFQALRIAVNDELHSIREALPKALELVDRRGRILIISFHSLEDRIIKQSFIEFEKNNKGRILTKKPIVPTIEEVNKNIRSRSAKLRVFEKN